MRPVAVSCLQMPTCVVLVDHWAQENWQEGKFDATADEEEIRLDGCDKPLRPEDKEEELDVLARQLSSQMEYNNLLLEHLQVSRAKTEHTPIEHC